MKIDEWSENQQHCAGMVMSDGASLPPAAAWWINQAAAYTVSSTRHCIPHILHSLQADTGRETHWERFQNQGEEKVKRKDENR